MRAGDVRWDLECVPKGLASLGQRTRAWVDVRKQSAEKTFDLATNVS